MYLAAPKAGVRDAQMVELTAEMKVFQMVGM